MNFHKWELFSGSPGILSSFLIKFDLFLPFGLPFFFLAKQKTLTYKIIPLKLESVVSDFVDEVALVVYR